MIDFPGAVWTIARGIAPDGTIVGYYINADSSYHGYFLEEDFRAIDLPGAIKTQINGISLDGRIVGEYTDAEGNGHGFVATREDALLWSQDQDDGGDGTGSGPVVSRADPCVLPRQATLKVRIFGSGFDADSRVDLLKDGVRSPEVRTEAVHFVGRDQLVATLIVAADSPLGAYDVQVEDRKGKQGIGTELIDVDSTAVTGTWDLAARLHLSTEDCVVSAELEFSQNDHDLHGTATSGFLCDVEGSLDAHIGFPISGAVAANGSDLVFILGGPGCEFRGAHEGGTASGEVPPCANLGNIIVAPEGTTFTGTWQAQRE